jgi:AraC-like DNA-binding protein
LGEAGLLDDRRCTTHWALVQYLQARHPKAKVLNNVLFVHDQGVTTSAGVTSGIDMALEFLEQDQGPLFTAEVARHLVIYLRRNGSQPQSSVYLQYRTHLHPGIHRVQDFLIHNPTVRVSLEQLAAIAHLSTRSLTRAFKQATGITPTQYQQRLKLELATTLLQNPELTVEEIANRCGFDDARHFRRLWRSQFGSPPSTKRSNRVTSYTQSALESIESKESLMLQLRPNCECCNKDLPPYSAEARICSFECTFCRVCAGTILQGRCPNCGGDLVQRPTRSSNLLLKYPASTERVYKPEGCKTSA